MTHAQNSTTHTQSSTTHTQKLIKVALSNKQNLIMKLLIALMHELDNINANKNNQNK